jgi:hypothetical protein
VRLARGSVHDVAVVDFRRPDAPADIGWGQYSDFSGWVVLFGMLAVAVGSAARRSLSQLLVVRVLVSSDPCRAGAVRFSMFDFCGWLGCFGWLRWMA